MSAAKNVTIVSPFRQNGAAYVDDYFNRAYQLHGQERLRWIVVEGDSTDDTLPRLIHYQIHDRRVSVVKCDVNAPRYGSEVNPARFKVLAMVFNAGLEAVDLDWSDYVMFLPSDVHYDANLVDRLTARKKDVIAPMFWASEGAHGRFYDIWGFRHNGQSFPPNPPAWYAANYPREPIEMDTVGGCILMRAAVVKAGCRYTPEEVDCGLCTAAWERGFSVWADMSTHIVHP